MPENEIRRSGDFRSVYASGVWLASSPTEFRLLFMNNEPVEVKGEGVGVKDIKEIPHYQVEIILGRELAKWLKENLEVQLRNQQEQPKPVT